MEQLDSVHTIDSNSVYHPLANGGKETRILHVDLSGLDSRGRVKCHLKNIVLTKRRNVKYEAISWCWGENAEEAQIVLSGQVTNVPKNAEHVLRRLCFEQGHDWVWLDAACINQTDENEKGHQVAMMSEIYAAAERVLIWLGDNYQWVDRAMDSINIVLEQCKAATAKVARLNLNHWKGFDDKEFIDAVHSQLWDDNGFPLGSDGALPTCDWEALFKFFSSPWFGRLWVVQEVLFSREAICFRGNCQMSWNDIGLAATWMRHRKFWRYYNDDRGRSIHRAANIWAHGKNNISSTSLLFQSIQLHTSNPLDKVYALLGLFQRSNLPRSITQRLKPDYSRSLPDTYVQWTRLCILAAAKSEFEPLYPLNIAQIMRWPISNAEQSRDTPSWVPRYDWQGYEHGASRRVEMTFTASAGQRISMRPESLDDKILHVRGVTVDVVTFCGPVMTNELLGDAGVLATSISAIRSIASGLGVCEQDIASTLTSGMNENFDSVKDDASFFQSFVEFKTSFERMLFEANDDENSSKDHESASQHPYVNALWRGSQDEAFFTTSTGRIGMGPQTLQPGDEVTILFGGQLPLILRQEGDHWRLLGTAYVNGIMEGECIRELQRKRKLKAESKWFDIL